MYDRGWRSPDAEIEPRNGTSGIRFSFNNATNNSIISMRTAEWPAKRDLHRTSMAPRTQASGMKSAPAE